MMRTTMMAVVATKKIYILRHRVDLAEEKEDVSNFKKRF
jgi:hypothetical protein